MGLLLGSGNTKPQYPYDQWYGVQGDFNSQDYKLKRVGNLDLHRTLPIQAKLKRFVENPDGSVKYYLNQNDSRKKDSGATALIDSTDGNVMLEKPEYYFKLEIEGTKWIRAYSEYPLPGFIKMERKTVSPWYATVDITNSVAVSGCWLTWNGDEIARDSDGFVILKANAAQFRGGSGAGDAAKMVLTTPCWVCLVLPFQRLVFVLFARTEHTTGRTGCTMKLLGCNVWNMPHCTAKMLTPKR